MTIGQRLRFGPYELDCDSLELWCDGVSVGLEPLPARILARLAREPGSLVSREDLRRLGWPATPRAADTSLNTCIHQIRRALTAGGPAVVEIRTVRRRGYRLAVLPARIPAREGPTPRAWRRRPGLGRARLVRMGVAATVAGVLALALWTDRARRTSSATTVAVSQMLSRARYLTQETQDLRGALGVLDSARARWPRAAAPQAEWAELQLRLGHTDDAERGARRALALDPGSATADRTLGALALLDGDWTGAEAALRRALTADPSDTRTLGAMAFLSAIEGRFDDADRRVRMALGADPLSATLHQDAGYLYLLMGRYPDADRYCRDVLRFRPDSAWAADCLFDLTTLTGRTDEGAVWGRRLLELQGAAPLPDDLPSSRVVARTEAWRLERWEEAVTRGAYPFGLALAYAANGRAGEAIAALELAAAHPRFELMAMAVDPRLASLHGYPAFQRLCERLRLPAAHRVARLDLRAGAPGPGGGAPGPS